MSVTGSRRTSSIAMRCLAVLQAVYALLILVEASRAFFALASGEVFRSPLLIVLMGFGGVVCSAILGVGALKAFRGELVGIWFPGALAIVAFVTIWLALSLSR